MGNAPFAAEPPALVDTATRTAAREEAADFFSARQLAIRYDVTISTIWRWRRTGVLPDAIKLSNGQSRFVGDVIRAWEASRPKVGDRPFPSAAEKKTQRNDRP